MQRLHHILIILWFPIWFILLVLLNGLASEATHNTAVTVFWVSSAIGFGLSLPLLGEMMRQSEFWLVLVSIVFSLGIAEIALRSLNSDVLDLLTDLDQLSQPNLWRYAPGHYVFTVNANWQNNEGDVVNSRGYRGEEITLPKQDNTFRIVALGGSTTYGTGVERWQDAYPAQLETILQERLSNPVIDVVNAGQPAYNSWETLINLEFRVLDIEPDLLIIYQNTNDVHTRLVPAGTYTGDNSGRRKPWDYNEQNQGRNPLLTAPSLLVRGLSIVSGLAAVPNQFIENYVSQPCSGPDLTAACAGAEPAELLAQHPPVYYERNLRSMVAIARAHDIQIMFMTWAYSDQFTDDDYATRDYYQQGFAEHNALMLALAEELDVPIFDLAEDFPMDREYWSDGRHMSAAGNQLRAEQLADYLLENNLLNNEP